MDREVAFPQLKIHWNEHESYRRQAAKPHGRPLLFFLRSSPRKISRTSLSLDLPSSFTNLATVDLGTPALAAISAVDSKANSSGLARQTAASFSTCGGNLSWRPRMSCLSVRKSISLGSRSSGGDIEPVMNSYRKTLVKLTVAPDLAEQVAASATARALMPSSSVTGRAAPVLTPSTKAAHSAE